MDKIKEQIPKGMKVLRALIFSYHVTGISLLILAVLLYKLDLGEGQITAGIVIIYILSCFFGGFLLGRQAESRRFLWGLVLGGVYFLLLLLISGLLEPGNLAGGKTMLTSLFLCLGGGMLGGMLAGS